MVTNPRQNPASEAGQAGIDAKRAKSRRAKSQRAKSARISAAQWQEIRRLHEAGMTFADLARLTGRSAAHLRHRFSREAGRAKPASVEPVQTEARLDAKPEAKPKTKPGQRAGKPKPASAHPPRVSSSKTKPAKARLRKPSPRLRSNEDFAGEAGTLALWERRAKTASALLNAAERALDLEKRKPESDDSQHILSPHDRIVKMAALRAELEARLDRLLAGGLAAELPGEPRSGDAGDAAP